MVKPRKGLNNMDSEKQYKEMFKSTEGISDIETERIRKTYLIQNLLIKAIDAYAYDEDIEKSEIVNQALIEYIPEKYIEQARKKIKKLSK